MKETKEIMENEASELSLMKEESKDAEVLCEDVSRRKENTKHFRMKNGNFMAVVYDEPVHKLNEKTGEFEEIKGEFTENETDFEASMKAFKVKLPKKEGKRKFVTVEKDGKSVSFRFASGKPTHTKRPEAKMHSEKKHYWEHKKYPTVKYEKVDNITSLEYEVNDGGIKENIVLTKCPETSTFKFDIKCEGLVPKLSEDKKTVVLLDEREETVMVIPPANMTDDNGVYSEEIHYELCETEEDITLEMVVENDWLSAYERKYPVVIDPRIDVITNYSTSSILMKEICNNGNLVSYAETRMVGMDTNGNIHRTYIKLPAVNLDSTAKIIKAELKFFIKNYVSDGDYYEVYKSNSSLDISNLTWSNQGTIYSSDRLATFYSYNSSKTVDITDLMEEMCSSGTSKMVVLKKSSETPTVTYPVSTLCLPGEGEDGGEETPDPVTTYGSVTVHSNTSSTVSKRPTAFIEYVPSDVYATNKAQYTFECGAAGTGAIDLNTGSLTFVHNDGISSGFRFAPPVAHIYKTEYMDKTETSNFGKGWALSPLQYLEIYGSGSTYKAKYTDSAGNIYYFVQNSDGTITDELGLGWTFSDTLVNLPEWLDTPRYYCIKDEHENSILFTEDKKFLGVLTNEEKGFALSTNDNGLYNVIVEEVVKNIDNRKITLEYGASGSKLSALKEYILPASGESDQLNGTAIMVYSGSGLLSSITKPDGKVTTFTYYDNRLTCITDYMGISCAFSYDDNGRVTSLITRGENIISNGQVTDGYLKNSSVIDIEYRAKSTAVINRRTKVKTVYVLDDYGRERYSYIDLSEASNSEKRTPTTMIQLNEYASTKRSNDQYANGKYCSMMVSVDKDDSYQQNYIANSHFSNGVTGWNSGDAINYGNAGISSTSYISDTENETRNSFYFSSSNTSNNKWIEQTVTLSPNSNNGNIFVASAWAKSTGHVPSTNTIAKFKMIVRVTYDDEYEEYSENFDVGCTSWQCVVIPFTLKKQANVMVKLDYSYNVGTCYFTNVRIVDADATFINNEYYVENSYLQINDMLDTASTEKIKIKTITTTENRYYTQSEYYDINSDKVMVNVYKKGNNSSHTNYYKYDNHILVKSMDYNGIINEYIYTEGVTPEYIDIAVKEYNQSNSNLYKYVKNSYDGCGRLEAKADQRIGYKDHHGLIYCPYSYYMYNDDGQVRFYDDERNRRYEFEYDGEIKDNLTKVYTNWYGSDMSNTMNYTNGFLTKVSSNSSAFTFTYDEIGRIKSIKIGSTELVGKSYTDTAEPTVTTTYANGMTLKIYSDIFGNPTKCVSGTSDVLFTADYLPNGAINYLVDNCERIKYNYIYNSNGNVTSVEHIDTNTNTVKYTDTFEYYTDGRTKNTTYGALSHKYIPVYETDSSGNLHPDANVKGITLENKFTESFATDGLRRIANKTLNISGASVKLFDETYSHLSTENSEKTINATTDFVANSTTIVAGTGGNKFTYEYDESGNIIKFTSDNNGVYKIKTNYYYDSLGRLDSEEDLVGRKLYEWTYDNSGNITSKKVYSYDTLELEKTYSYSYTLTDWHDKLMVFDGTCCVYDNLGNPTTYCSNELEWGNGRQLKKFNNHTFEYNSSGIRIKKNNTTYTLDGDRILKETDGTNTLVYYYGIDGVVGFNYNGTDYYYRKNLMGDIMEIYTSSGVLAASYAYDAWGKLIRISDYNGCTVANVNPFRFKSYYYDTEMGLYYLNSRYYDPEVGRFISPDSLDYLDPETLGGTNLYAYCFNNPVMYVDPTGNFPILALVLGITALVGLGLTVGGVASDNNTLTAIGLTMVAIPALISGGMAIVAGFGGAILTGIVGGITALAGIGTGLFASAEYQEAFTGNNWMLDAGMSEGWYNGLMLATATIATAGTFASSFMSAFKIKSINKIGKLTPSNHPNDGYFGIRFKNNRGALRSIEFQNHAPHGVHLQLNSWNPKYMSVSTIRRWTWFLTKM